MSEAQRLNDLRGSSRKVGFLGAGGQAIEMLDYCQDEVQFFAVERQFLQSEEHVPRTVDIAEPGEAFAQSPVIAAIGAPGLKRMLLDRWAGVHYGRVIAADATIAASARIGAGVVIAPGAKVMARVVLGDHVLVNTGAIISHECVVGNYATVSPGAALGGRCILEQGVFVGIGATLRDGVRIGEGAVIGAGAVVIDDVAPGTVVVGSPSRELRKLDDWLTAL
ncbi:acetyltransferase [Leucobacter sp. gxy201]|uniref:acetyltransferase n=1 Tax=Leucobacter sp. gxy201 TaxID=2957200 RepID=UPI003DA18AA8